APRHQARQPAHHARRPCEDHRLRHRAYRRPGSAHRDRSGHGHRPVPLPRAGLGAPGFAGHRHLLARHRRVRVRGGQASVHGRVAGRDRHGADQRAAAAAARHRLRPGAEAHPRDDREEARRPSGIRIGRRAGGIRSSPWRSRRGACRGAGDRGRCGHERRHAADALRRRRHGDVAAPGRSRRCRGRPRGRGCGGRCVGSRCCGRQPRRDAEAQAQPVDLAARRAHRPARHRARRHAVRPALRRRRPPACALESDELGTVDPR
ncbi:MAG: hypothetical protein K0S70_3402, partial [Microbacterium sp.]|nr:hypothetical protein [Microbacterium sp.]